MGLQPPRPGSCSCGDVAAPSISPSRTCLPPAPFESTRGERYAPAGTERLGAFARDCSRSIIVPRRCRRSAIGVVGLDRLRSASYRASLRVLRAAWLIEEAGSAIEARIPVQDPPSIRLDQRCTAIPRCRAQLTRGRHANHGCKANLSVDRRSLRPAPAPMLRRTRTRGFDDRRIDPAGGPRGTGGQSVDDRVRRVGEPRLTSALSWGLQLRGDPSTWKTASGVRHGSRRRGRRGAPG